jgi:hypothetical protein
LTTPITAASLNAVCDELALYNTAWTSYTPTWSNLTIGNAVLSYASYALVGKICFVKVYYTFGSTTNATSTIGLSLPVAMASNYATAVQAPIGMGYYTDSSSSLTYPFIASRSSSSVLRFFAHNASATYVSVATVNASVPATLTTGNATGDTFQFSAFYETV